MFLVQNYFLNGSKWLKGIYYYITIIVSLKFIKKKKKKRTERLHDEVSIAIVGKYNALHDSYLV
mgnify:CR=1 FL=1